MNMKRNLIAAIVCTVVLAGCSAGGMDGGRVLSNKIETSKFLKAYENTSRVDVSVDDDGVAYFI